MFYSVYFIPKKPTQDFLEKIDSPDKYVISRRKVVGWGFQCEST